MLSSLGSSDVRALPGMSEERVRERFLYIYIYIIYIYMYIHMVPQEEHVVDTLPEASYMITPNPKPQF